MEELRQPPATFGSLVAVMPLVVRALFGEKHKSLEAEIAPHVARNVAFFLAACRNARLIRS
jgi:hypothetical protein